VKIIKLELKRKTGENWHWVCWDTK